MRKCYLFFLMMTILPCITYAQHTERTYSLQGTVQQVKSKKIISNVVVSIPEYDLWATSDTEGKFSITRIPAGKTQIVVRCLGYKTLEIAVDIQHDQVNRVFQLMEENLELETVVVTARTNRSQLNTSIKMERQAIEHMQVSNPADIMSLMPGGKTVNPNLMNESIFNFRGGDGNGSFGTAVQIDGIPLTSNAELGSLSGIGTRHLGVSNIEEIEVLAGVPSVEYGDMTTGMVIIHTKKQASPYQVTLSLNPSTKSLSLGKGFDLKGKNGVLYANIEYSEAFSDPVSRHSIYFRNVYGLNYSNTFRVNGKPLNFNVSIGGSYGRRDEKNDPDVPSTDWSKANDHALRFGVSSKWLINTKWITNLEARLNASYNDHMTESRTYNSYPHIVQTINSLVSGYFETNYRPTQFYLNRVTDSKSLNFSADIKAGLHKKIGGVNNNIRYGLSWKTSGNVGKGEIFRQGIFTNNDRPRPYTDIPFMHNMAAYLEDNASISMGETTLAIMAGVRMDAIRIKGMIYDNPVSFSPRFNARYTLKENHADNDQFLRELSFRGGWGISEKLPSLGVLYPSPRYRDISVYSVNYGAENQYFNAAYTRVSTDAFNPGLKWSKSRNVELGLSANLGGVNLSITYWNNKSMSPYETLLTPVVLPYKKFDPQFPIPNNPEFSVNSETGEILVWSKNDANPVKQSIPMSLQDTIYAYNNMQGNGPSSSRQGVELMVDFGTIKAIRTSFLLDANYHFSKSINERLYPSVPGYPHPDPILAQEGRSYPYVGYYVGATNVTYNGSKSDQLNANLRTVTHIPEIRMTVSLRLESNIFTRSLNQTRYNGKELAFMIDESNRHIEGSVYGRDEYRTGVWPVMYGDLSGNLKPFTEVEAADPRFTQLLNVSNTNYSFVEDGNNAYFMANISLTKEIGRMFGLSFYANNFTYSKPYIKSWANGRYSTRNIDFAYGATLRIKI